MNERLQRLLADPKAADAARIAARQHLDGRLDEAGLEEALDLIESRLVELEPVEAVPDPAEFELAERLERLKAQRIPVEILEELLQAPVGEAVERAKALEVSVAEVRKGPEPVELRWRGEWLPGVEYQPGDVVALNGSSYVCVHQTSEQPRLFHKAWKALAVGGTGPSGPAGPEGPAGPAGATDHDALTGVSADDHHARDHSITGAVHTFPGGTTTFLRADGTFAAPAASVTFISTAKWGHFG